MPDVVNSEEKVKRYDSREITENSASLIKGAASDLEVWTKLLRTIAQHPNESANNCAAIMASSYEDTRELRNEREWGDLGGAVKPGERGIPLVHRSKSGNFFVDLLYPASAVEGARDHYRGLPVHVDLEDEIDGPAFLAAAEKWGALLSDASPNIGFIVFSRYGLSGGPDPVLPDPEVVSDAKALATYCRDLKRDAENLIFKFDATIDAVRRNMMRPKVERSEEVVEDERKAQEPQVQEPAPSVNRAGVSRPEFDAASHVSDPTSIYSAAASAAKMASSDNSGQAPNNHI